MLLDFVSECSTRRILMAGILVQFQKEFGEDRAIKIADVVNIIVNPALPKPFGTAYEVKQFEVTFDHPSCFVLILFFKHEVSKRKAKRIRRKCLKLIQALALKSERVACEFQRVQGEYSEDFGNLENFDNSEAGMP
jgi:hypothetical protein